VRSIVYLIGAGPGAPDLITLRGYHCLQQADVVIYDHRVHADVLQYAPPQAERIDVGGASADAGAQNAICLLIAEKAREGKSVARLKRGDSFLFDQGGEEALFLHEQGIPFEVVPGVPAALGAAAYAGIPITYRGGGDTVTFVRGYEDDRRERSRLNWDHLAGIGGTIVCYAGPRQLPKMIESLIAHGRARDESAAIIANGTLSSQRTITGTLEELGKAADEHPAGAALLIVGRVVNFRDHLRWFDSRPLFGRRALVMHSKEQPDEIATLLAQHGAEVLVDTDTGLDVYRLLLERKVDVVTFTTAAAVLGFLASVGADQASDLLAHTVVATLGPAAADAVARANVTPAVQLSSGSLSAFADAIAGHFKDN
jgi:uroporphyrinogen III methyltransferase/synthase